MINHGFSPDNGNNYFDETEIRNGNCDETIENYWDSIVLSMSDGIREEIHLEGIEDNREFLARYIEEAGALILG